MLHHPVTAHILLTTGTTGVALMAAMMTSQNMPHAQYTIWWMPVSNIPWGLAESAMQAMLIP